MAGDATGGVTFASEESFNRVARATRHIEHLMNNGGLFNQKQVPPPPASPGTVLIKITQGPTNLNTYLGERVYSVPEYKMELLPVYNLATQATEIMEVDKTKKITFKTLQEIVNKSNQDVPPEYQYSNEGVSGVVMVIDVNGCALEIGKIYEGRVATAFNDFMLVVVESVTTTYVVREVPDAPPHEETGAVRGFIRKWDPDTKKMVDMQECWIIK